MGWSKSANVMWIVLLLQLVNAAAAAEPITARITRVETDLRPAIVIDGRIQGKLSLRERMQFYKTPGVSIAVINNGVIEWARGYGEGEAGTTNPVTPDTQFQAASITKPVAAMVALRLVEQGKLDLDEDVNANLVTWKLPDNEFTREKKVTLRLLLSHRAGLTDNAGFLGNAPTEPLPSLRDILESGKWTPQPVRVGLEPGTQFRYSGGGYCLIEQLLEDVSGKPFPALARELVQEPLGMTNSHFEQPLPAKGTRAAVGHRANGKPLPKKWNIYPAGAGGLWTTPTDLARFVIELQEARQGKSSRVLSPAMTAEMLSLQGRWDEDDSKRIAMMESFSDKLPLGRGLGVGLIGQPPQRFYHTGFNSGYQCEFQAYLENGQGAIVMTNADQGWRLGREILCTIAREYDWPEYDCEPEVRKVAHVSRDALVPLVGQYRLGSKAGDHNVVSITEEGNRLFLEVSDHLHKVELFPESETKFFTLECAMNLAAMKDAAGAVSEIRSDHGWRAKRIMGE